MLLELAERCEQATGPMRELDGAIAALLSGHEVQRVTVGPDHRREDFSFIDRSDGAPISRPVPRFTASVDAALSLVPDGCRVHELTDWHGIPNGGDTWAAELHRQSERRFVSQGDAATAALAITAASLRAIAQGKSA